MSDPKVVVDTNVLVSASILRNISELDTEIKHEFYDQSIQLFSLFRKYRSKRIGYLVPKVRTESFSVLSKAVKSVFVPSTLQDPKRKEIFYNDAVAIINASEHKMRDLMKLLFSEKLDEQKITTNLKNIKKMSAYLMNQWNQKYNRKGWRTRESKKRSKSIMKEIYWKEEQKKEVVYTHKGQIDRESRQIYRFQRKHPNWQDERILAESITLKQKLEDKTEKFNFMIASCDSGFFSPYIGLEGVSDTVTREIQQRFNIRCDYPRTVFFRAGGR